MAFSDGVLAPDAAHRRFDEMAIRADELPFAKQPVIERSTGLIIGYSGVNWFTFEGKRSLEFGYRLVAEARDAATARRPAMRCWRRRGRRFAGPCWP